MDALEVAARDRRVARHARADREHDRVVLVAELGSGDVDADVHAEAKLHAFVGELREPPHDDVLLDLEVRDAEANEPTAGLVALEDGDEMPGAVELLCGCKAG